MEKGFTVWFTGLSGSGKSTLASEVAAVLRKKDLRVEILDGDIIRTNISKGLGFSRKDRDINIQRIGFVCELLNRNGVVAIVAAISPYRKGRNENRKKIKRYVEVYCKCPLKILKKRDVKGLYRKAIAGKIKNFTGVSDPYEPPENPEVIMETDCETEEESISRVILTLENLGYITMGHED